MLSTSAPQPSGHLLRDLIAQLPVACVLFDQHGAPMVRSHRFDITFSADALGQSLIREMIGDPHGDWRQVILQTHSGEGQACRAQAVLVDGFVLLSVDGDGSAELVSKIDELLAQNAELERLRSTDALTGIWNRGQFERAVALELDRSVRFKQPLSLVLLDIDHFKRINDGFGHRTGDSVLKEIARVVTNSIRLIDGLYRWGGEEFAILAASTSYKNARRLAEKVRLIIERHEFAEIGRVTVSIGVAEHLSPESQEDWFSRADSALYLAKTGGRNRVCVDEAGDSDLWETNGEMPLIRLIWRDAYECGHPQIDGEHRELVDLANAVFDASFGVDKDPSRIKSALERLMSHVAAHFAHEEQLLADFGYDRLGAHQAAHQGLLNRARELQAEVESGVASTGALIEFLANKVVAQHLSGADKDFFPLVAGATTPH